MRTSIQELRMDAEAPSKPAMGAACNGCGLCCAAERCPMAHLFLLRSDTPCPALEWSAGERHYRCGLVVHPAAYVRWLPRRWQAHAGRWFAARIAAGSGCDFDASELDSSRMP